MSATTGGRGRRPTRAADERTEKRSQALGGEESQYQHPRERGPVVAHRASPASRRVRNNPTTHASVRDAKIIHNGRQVDRLRQSDRTSPTPLQRTPAPRRYE